MYLSSESEAGVVALPIVLPKYRAQEPKWHEWARLRYRNIPAIYKWLYSHGSLTRHLQHSCPNAFRVKIHVQVIDRLLLSERRLLGLPKGAKAMAREVYLCCAERPWVFARTLIPSATTRGSGRRLKFLGERPLGAVLFSNPTMQRHHVEIARLMPHHVLFRKAVYQTTYAPPELWGRRTLFMLAGKPLLVNEIFLPEIPVKK